MKDYFIIEEYKKAEKYLITKFPVVDGLYLKLVNLSSIMFVKANGSYSQIYTNDNASSLLSTKPLAYYERNLPEHSFFRVHKSYIINLNFLQCIKRDHHWSVELKGETISIADAKKDELLEKLGIGKSDLEADFEQS